MSYTVTRHEFTYPSRDTIHDIHAVRWEPDVEKPRAVLQIVHGISEYILRYDDFASFIAQHGFLVVGNDHLGHGKTARSPSEYGFFSEKDGWRNIVSDVHRLREDIGTQYPGIPYCLLGHSMGSFVARTYLIVYPGTVDAVILSGTGQESAFNVAVGKFLTSVGNPKKVNRLFTVLSLGAYNKKFKPNRTRADWISRDVEIVDRYVSDPLCSFVPTAEMNHEMMAALQFIADPGNLAKMAIETPVLFVSGDRDPVGAMGKGVHKVEKYFRSAGVRDITVRLYAGGRHEMLNEINRAEVYEDILSWLNEHIKTPGFGGI